MDPNTVFGGVRVDRDGVQVAHKMVLFRGISAREPCREGRRRCHPRSAGVGGRAGRGYGGCQILVEAIRRAGSLDSEKLRDAILKMNHDTVFGAFRVDRDGVQVGHKLLLFQWQDGKKVIVWPEELAANQPRFPRPPWSQRP